MEEEETEQMRTGSPKMRKEKISGGGLEERDEPMMNRLKINRGGRRREGEGSREKEVENEEEGWRKSLVCSSSSSSTMVSAEKSHPLWEE